LEGGERAGVVTMSKKSSPFEDDEPKKVVSSFRNKIYVLWNVYLPNALHSVCLNRLSCTEVGIYNGANSSRDMEGVSFCVTDSLTHSVID